MGSYQHPKNLCGRRVKIARVSQEMTQTDLSAALSVDFNINLSANALSCLEIGKRTVRDIELVALAQVLGVTIEWLVLGNKGEPMAPIP
ncbi:MAG: helix-turn-helix transcriptional regulator [Alphaproteobacteria bacterium]|nr:helix-turn-helix transcriptional regulator [Alphaproteobacteria bacterium]